MRRTTGGGGVRPDGRVGGGSTAPGYWSYYNGASGSLSPTTPVNAVSNEVTGALTTNVITLGTPVAASGTLTFTFANGTIASGDRKSTRLNSSHRT